MLLDALILCNKRQLDDYNPQLLPEWLQPERPAWLLTCQRCKIQIS